MGRSLGGRITRANGGLLGSTFPLPGSAGRRRGKKGSLTMALRWLLLHGWPGARHKMINHHCPSCHYVFTSIGFSFKGANRFGSCFLGFFNGSFGFDRSLEFNRGLRLNESFRLNRLVCLFSTVLRHMINQLIPYWCKFVRTGVSWTKVVSIAYCESRRKEVLVSYVDIR